MNFKKGFWINTQLSRCSAHYMPVYLGFFQFHGLRKATGAYNLKDIAKSRPHKKLRHTEVV